MKGGKRNALEKMGPPSHEKTETNSPGKGENLNSRPERRQKPCKGGKGESYAPPGDCEEERGKTPGFARQLLERESSNSRWKLARRGGAKNSRAFILERETHERKK